MDGRLGGGHDGCEASLRAGATQSSWGLARGERVSGVGENWRTLAGSLRKLAMTDGGPRGFCLAFVVPKKCAPGGARSGWEASLRGEEWFLHGKNEKRR